VKMNLSLTTLYSWWWTQSI